MASVFSPNILELYVNLREAPLTALRSSNSFNPMNTIASPPQIICNDRLTVRVYLFDSSDVITVIGTPATLYKYRKLPSGSTLSIQAVPRQPISSGPLWNVGDATLVESGSELAYYEMQVNTNTEAMSTLLATVERKEIMVNIQASDSSYTRTLAYFSAIALKDLLLDGASAVPVSTGFVSATDKATSSEARGGTVDTKWMTPLKTKQLIQRLPSVAPYQYEPSSDVELAAPTLPSEFPAYEAGQRFVYQITPTAAITLTMGSTIKIPSDITFTSRSLTSGMTTVVELYYDGTDWVLVSIFGEY